MESCSSLVRGFSADASRTPVLAGAFLLGTALLLGMVLGPAALGLSSAPGCTQGYGGYGGYGGYAGSGGYGGYGGYSQGYGGFGHCYDGETTPKAFFAVQPQYPRVGVPTTFDSAGSYDLDDAIVAREWDLDGDGQYNDASGTTASLTFASADEHVVGLRVTDASGLTFALRKTVDVHTADWSPKASISRYYGPSFVIAQQPTTFLAGAEDLDTATLAVAWDLDDDGQFDDATGPSATTTFATSGLHTVSVQVDDGIAPAVVSSSTFTVAMPGQVAAPLLGPFLTFPRWPRAARGTLMQATFLCCDGYSHDWDFGDGQNDSGRTVTHTYGAGVFTVTIDERDASPNPVAHLESVLPVTSTNIPPTVTLSASPPDPRAGQHVRLFATGDDPDNPAGGSLAYAWDTDGDGAFDDGTGRILDPPLAVAGPVNVAVQVTDIDGATAIARVFGTVRTLQPTAGFNHSPASPEVAAVVHFTSDSVDADGSIVSELWDLDHDGQFDDASGPTATARFSTTGTHVVSLKVRDSSGDTDAVAHTVTVVPGASVTQTVAAGGTVSTGGTPTESDPVTTAVTSPVAGQVTITEGAVTTGAPAGYSIFGQEVDITAPTATAANPLRITFRIDASLLPAGVGANEVVVMRDGSPIGDCADASGAANPDPCITGRANLAGGDVELTVLTSHASHWNFATKTSTGGSGGGGGGTDSTPAPAGETPVTTVTTQPIGTPAARRDTTRPSARLSVARGQKLRRALKKGLRITVRCSERCTVQATAGIAKALAKKLKLGKKAVIVARGRGTARSAGNAAVVLKFTAAAARKLATLRAVPLRLTALVADTSGNSRTVILAFKLSR